MNLLFLCISLPDLNRASGLYADLLKELADRGYNVYALCSSENGMPAGFTIEHGVKVIRTKVPFLRQNTSLLRKGIGSLMMNPCFKRSFSKFLRDIQFDWLLLPTPPPTMVDIVKAIRKKQPQTKVYLVLRDIQPECANRSSISPDVYERTDVYDECKIPFNINPFARRLLYKKSQSLYKLSDVIGCMSPGNASFVKKIAPYVEDYRLKMLPNWYTEPEKHAVDEQFIRVKYGLIGKFVAIFGGNIGPQQAVWNIAQLAKMNINKKDAVFLVVGRGVAKHVLENMAKQDNLNNILFLEYMPREDYEALLQIADLGIISLDEKYQVPTCPSKIIGYMALQKPVIAMINKGSDYGEFYIDKSCCGLWSAGLDNEKMFANYEWMYYHPDERKEMGKKGYDYFKEHFSTQAVTDLMVSQIELL